MESDKSVGIYPPTPIYERARKNTEEKIIAIGQELISRADKISKDLDGVTKIIIHGEIDGFSPTKLKISKEMHVKSTEGIVI